MRIVKDLAGLVCGPETPIRAAIAALNANPLLFQLVAAPDGRVLGALTDGDVRRGLLRNVLLEEPVSRIMNATPVVATEADYERYLARLPDLAGFLPLVDGEGKLQAVIVRALEAEAIRAALILAGGRGRRLGERTQTRPKPLIAVADRPILEHVLAAAERAGVAEIFVAVHYLADQIEDYLAARKNVAKIEVLRETSPLGTAGALALLPDLGDAPLLVLNGDLITRVDLGALGDFHLRNGFDATIGASEHTVQLPYGVIRYREDGTFLRIDEKPVVRNLVSGGIYALSAACRRLVKPGGPVDMPDLLNSAEAAGLQIGVFPIHEYWQDVGVPADLDRAEKHHRGGDDG